MSQAVAGVQPPLDTIHFSAVPDDLRRRLPPVKRARVAFEILGIYARTRRLLGRHDVSQVIAELRAPALEVAPAEESVITHLQAARLGWAVRRTLRILPTDTRCLSQSLVLTGLLARRGIPSTLIIGVSSEPPRFEAHAWVEYCGRPLLPDDGDVFQPLTRL